MKSNISWGWRIDCQHLDCEEFLESWSEGCTPSLRPMKELSVKGWFVLYDPTRIEADNRFVDVCFCPYHSQAAFEYVDASIKWRENFYKARHQIWNYVATIVDCVLQNRKQSLARAYIEQWQRLNPAPLPPWIKS